MTPPGPGRHGAKGRTPQPERLGRRPPGGLAGPWQRHAAAAAAAAAASGSESGFKPPGLTRFNVSTRIIDSESCTEARRRRRAAGPRAV